MLFTINDFYRFINVALYIQRYDESVSIKYRLGKGSSNFHYILNDLFQLLCYNFHK